MGLNIGRSCFFFNDTATTEIYTLSLPDALPNLTITTTGGLTALNPIALSSLTSGSWNTNKAQFVGTGGTTIVVGDRVLISTTTYPSGYGVQIADSQGILYAHALG